MIRLQSFAPAKILYERPARPLYTIQELTDAVMYAVRKIIYPEMTDANKALFDEDRAIFTRNRNRGLVAVRYFMMYFLNKDYRWHDRRCAQYFDLNRTMSITARVAIEGQLTAKFPNQYKDVYALIKRGLTCKYLEKTNPVLSQLGHIDYR